MNSSKRLLRHYFKTPLYIKVILAVSVLSFILCVFLAGKGFSNEVAKKDQKDYVSYNGELLRAGDKAYLDVTGIGETLSYRDTLHYHIVLDEGVNADEWYFYIVLLSSETYNKMTVQQKYYDDENSPVETYRLWGTVIAPSSAFVQEISEELGMSTDDYYQTFGDTYLSVNTSNPTKTLVTTMAALLSVVLFASGLILWISHKVRVSKMIKLLKTYLLLDRAAEELGNAPVTDDDPIFTRNFLFNRKTVTTAFMPDIIMVDSMSNIREKILAGYLRQGVYVALSGKNTSQYPMIIEKIRECNPDLMTEYNMTNLEKYSAIVNEGKEAV